MNNNEERLIKIAQEIVGMSDSVIGVTGKILGYNSYDFGLLKELFEKLSGHELSIPRDAIEVRKFLREYLRNNNIEVPDDPSYEIEHFNPRTNENYLKTWNDDDMINSRKAR